MKTLGRVLTAMITPFNEDGSVDFQGAVKLGRHLLEHGSDGLVICGTTGEGITISDDDKFKLFEVMVKELKGLGTLIANTGSNDTLQSAAFTARVSTLDLDGIMAVVPYYNKPNNDGCYIHFKTIAESTNLPIILYNVPSRTGSSMNNEVIVKLAHEFPHICALKDAAGNIPATSDLMTKLPTNFMLYSGEDALTLPLLAIGGCGVISVASHIAGKAINEMIQAFENGKIKEAMTIHQKLTPLFKNIFITTNPIPVKVAIRMMNLPAGPFRLPLTEPNAAHKEIIEGLIKEYKEF